MLLRYAQYMHVHSDLETPGADRSALGRQSRDDVGVGCQTRARAIHRHVLIHDVNYRLLRAAVDPDLSNIERRGGGVLQRLADHTTGKNDLAVQVSADRLNRGATSATFGVLNRASERQG